MSDHQRDIDGNGPIVYTLLGERKEEGDANSPLSVRAARTNADNARAQEELQRCIRVINRIKVKPQPEAAESGDAVSVPIPALGTTDRDGGSGDVVEDDSELSDCWSGSEGDGGWEGDDEKGSPEGDGSEGKGNTAGM